MDPKKDDKKTTQTDDQSQQDDLLKKVNDLQAETEAKEQEEATQQDDSGTSSDDQINELKAALARAMADLQNFKRRSEEEKASFVKFANAQLLKSLLPIFDNLSRSVQHLPEDLKGNEWAKGIVHINSDLLKNLETLGIQKMKTVGEKLDPKKHEALMAGPGEKDVIVEEFEPGYEMNGEVVKAAKVKVGDGTN